MIIHIDISSNLIKTKALLIALTCKCAFNIDNLTIHLTLNIPVQQSLFNLPNLSSNSLNRLTCQYEKLQLVGARMFNVIDNRLSVATLTWPSVGVKPNTWKELGFGVLRDSRMFKLDRKGQNTLHWGVLGVIGKVLKRKYRKWPRIGHLDICSPSYG
jgi:hypothetical protein